MLSEWQTMLLDNGIWLLPTLCVVSMAVFPWRDWDSMITRANHRKQWNNREETKEANMAEHSPWKRIAWKFNLISVSAMVFIQLGWH